MGESDSQTQEAMARMADPSMQTGATSNLHGYNTINGPVVSAKLHGKAAGEKSPAHGMGLSEMESAFTRKNYNTIKKPSINNSIRGGAPENYSQAMIKGELSKTTSQFNQA